MLWGDRMNLGFAMGIPPKMAYLYFVQLCAISMVYVSVSVYVHVHVHIYAYVHVYVHVHVHVHVHIHMYVKMNMFTSVFQVSNRHFLAISSILDRLLFYIPSRDAPLHFEEPPPP